jgi:hypothetical protein
MRRGSSGGSLDSGVVGIAADMSIVVVIQYTNHNVVNITSQTLLSAVFDFENKSNLVLNLGC